MFENKYIIKSISQPSNDLVLLDLVAKNGGPVFDYKPGQYVMISYVNDKGQLEEKHSFSIASSPTEKGVLRLGIRVMGRFTQGLLRLKPNSDILVYGPFGTFSFNENKHLNAVFLAGGIGITPFLSALAYATDKKLPNQLSLLYSNRTFKGTAFFDDLKNIEKANPNVKMLFSVTDEKTPAKTAGIINERFCTPNLRSFINTVEGKTFFLCGPVPFMNGMKSCLLELGAKEEQILMEEFSMTTKRSAFSKVNYAMAMAGYGALAALLPFYMIYAANTATSNKTSDVKLPADAKSGDEEESESALDKIIEALPNLEMEDDSEESESTYGAAVNGDEEIEAEAIIPKSVSDAVKKAVAPVTKTVTKPATTKTATPAPKTATSITSHETAPATTKPAAAVAPKPTTASSVTSHTTTPAPTTQTNTNTTPAPTTSASGSTASGQTSASQTTTNTAPSPTTSASGSAGSTGNNNRDDDDDDDDDD